MVGGFHIKKVMFNLKLIPHKEVTQNELYKIIQIKSTAWSYSYEKQLEWINSNLSDLDIHVLLYLNGEAVAYLNLIDIELIIDGSLKKAYGIGNVCANEKRKGFGKKLISRVNLYLVKKNKIGLLFCKPLLVDFYIYNNWSIIEKKKLALIFNNELIETMIFNCKYEFSNLVYLRESF